MSGTVAKIGPQWLGTLTECATSSSTSSNATTTNNNTPSIETSSSSSSSSNNSNTKPVTTRTRETRNNIIKTESKNSTSTPTNKATSNSSTNDEPPFTIRKDVLTRISKFLNDSSYKDIIESSSSFNQKLVQERKFRLPFLDSQTGVAQSDCRLWMTENDRLPQKDSTAGTPRTNSGKIYTYPAKRWIKRKRQYLLDDIYLRTRSAQHHHSTTMGSSNAAQDSSVLLDHSSNDTHQLLHHSHPQQHNNSSSGNAHVKMTETSAGHNSNSNSFYNHNDSVNHNHHNDSSFMHDSSSNSNAYPWTINEQSKDATTSSKVDPDESTSETTVHGDYEDSNDPQHPQQNNLTHHQQQQSTTTHQNQSSNHQQPKQSHHSTPTSSTPKKKRERKFKIEKSDDPLKPYKCEWCDMSYKTRPGLTYHRNHCHAQNIVCNSSGDDTINNDEASNSVGNNHTGNQSSNPNNTTNANNKPSQSSSSSTSLASAHHLSSANSKSTENAETTDNSNNNKNGTAQKANVDNNNDNSPYCDFCLGDAKENKKTQKPEELVSCSDCGRSGHPTCLNFTPNIILSVKKYKWQCIECKSCGLCGTSDNDDQLLFCDDCDRGYHMYCLNPPLADPPAGLWSCSLCIEEYHKVEKEKIKVET